MDKVDLEDARGFRLASILDPNSPAFTSRSKPTAALLEVNHHRQLCDILGRSSDVDTMPKTAMFLNEVSRNGVCYGTSKASTFKNSSIIFQDRNSSDNSIKAGIASDIFQYRYLTEDGQNTGNIFFIMQILEPVEARLDPYRTFSFGGFLCRTTDREMIISLAQIKSHFALTRFDGLVHVLPVDRVCICSFILNICVLMRLPNILQLMLEFEIGIDDLEADPMQTGEEGQVDMA